MSRDTIERKEVKTMSEFKGQSVIITGGSGGMGLSIAEAFLKEGEMCIRDRP